MNPFLTEIFPFAQSASQRTGIDPRIIAAQAALETGYGKHAPGHNYFGIKSHGMPGGATLATTEVINGQPVRTKSSFRQYPGMKESAEGYADFMLSNPRYGPLMKAQGLDAQLDALQASGYATDPNYSNKLRGIIGKMDPVNARINQGFSLFDDDIDRTVNNIGPVAQPRAGMAIPGVTMGTSDTSPRSGFREFLTENRATLMGLAADLLARGADARRPIAGSGMMAGTLADERRGERRAKREEATQQRNMTADYIARTRPDLAEAMRAGVLSPGDAYKMAMQPGPKPEYREVGGKLYQMQDGQASLVPGIDYQSGGMFAGTGANVQAVNDMIARGEITREQGAQWLSGKVVTGPEGQLIHITPEQVFGGQPQTRSAGGSTGTQITPPKETPQMRQAKGFYDRMLSSQGILEKSGLEEALTDAWSAGAGGIIGGRYVQSDAYKSARQAAENWIRANLRKESGAAIGEKEMEDEYAVYFPLPGDGPEQIAQKRQAREIATQNMLREAEGSAIADQMEAQKGEKSRIIQEAEEAIKNGADPDAVWQRTIELFKGM